ncbi:SRPBCC family protein [Flavobacterium rhizosphaerae]|uniref:SRPBCC family protein n=1 Tax=Flavobacterium rhizosphaerae TaxID=3163298 RepID=A0ABW8YUE0_9FLAO
MELAKNGSTGTVAYSKQKRNYSKYDASGTDPNRYASVSNATEADEYLHKGKKSIVPGLRVNVSTPERIIMVAAGAYLLYRAFKKNDKRKVAESLAGGTMLFRGISGYCPAYDTINQTGVFKGGSISINSKFTVNKPVEEVYKAWRNLENLPLFMEHLTSVTTIDDYISEWKATAKGVPGNLSWKAEILMDEPNELISWHSMPESTIHNAGKVRFKDTGNGTEVNVTISYQAPLGKAGEFAAKLINPVFENMIKSDIEGFKQYIEAGHTPSY